MESIVLFREVFGKVFQKFVGTPHLPGNETQGPVILTVGVVLGPVLNLSKSFQINCVKPWQPGSINPSPRTPIVTFSRIENI